MFRVTAQKKRKLFEPIFERAIEVLRQAGRLKEFKARASRPGAKDEDVTVFIAEIVIAKEEAELLKDFTLAAVLRGRLSAEGITWNDDTEIWHDLGMRVSIKRSDRQSLFVKQVKAMTPSIPLSMQRSKMK